MSGMRVQLQTTSLHHLNPYVKDAEADVKEVVKCAWVFTVTGNSNSRKAMNAVLELRRKGGGQVMAGDAISNLVITVDENGKSTVHLFRPNMTLLQVKSGSVITVSLSSTDHSRVSMDNALFIRMFLVSGDSCPSDSELFHKYRDSCITVRPASFICGTNQHLDNCSLMTKLAIQASADELTELVRNVSFNKKFSRHFLSRATVISGFLCKDGTLMTRGSIPGKLTGIAKQCRATSGLQFVTVRVTGDGKPDLSLVSSERASQLLVLLDTSADHATEAPVSNVPIGNPMIGIMVAVIVTLAIIILFGIITYKLYTKSRIRDTNPNNIQYRRTGTENNS